MISVLLSSAAHVVTHDLLFQLQLDSLGGSSVGILSVTFNGIAFLFVIHETQIEIMQESSVGVSLCVVNDENVADADVPVQNTSDLHRLLVTCVQCQ